MTGKMKLFADKVIAEPTKSATQIVREVYNVTTDNSASQIASENLRKPQILAYMEKHVDKAQNRVVELINSDREDIALRASQDILDRVHGKATQKIEAHTTSVVIGIDLSAGADTSLEV